jgi:subtilisin family serine protease
VNYFKRPTILFLAGLLFLAGSFSHGSFVRAAPPQQYIVQIVGNPHVLSSVSTNAEQLFASSTAPVLQGTYSFTSTLSLAELRSRLATQVKYIEEDHEIIGSALSITTLVTTNDPGFTANESNIDRQWGLPKANFLAAWDKTKGSTATVVAVIDTGIDATHQDFAGTAFVEGYDVATQTPIRGRVNSDDNGHGTLVAGVIGATTNNGIGIAGSNWNVSLMPIKALNSKGSGDSSDIADGIVWAADHGAHVINMSLGGIGFAHDTTLANAITYAFNKNVVIVAAAGNDVAITGGNLDVNPVFPICNDNGQNMVLGVTASDVNDLKPDFANFGKSCIDVSAPGKRILSTINHDPLNGGSDPDSYAYASGTSLAVPFVSGQAALLHSMFPSASNQQIRNRIIGTADQNDSSNFTQCGGSSCKGLLGAGRINVANSLDKAIAAIFEGDVVQVEGQTVLYLINGGKRQLITPFVRNQRFSGVVPKLVTQADLDIFPEGPFAEPLDGTLIKADNSGTVYFMSKGLRLPVTFQVFQLYGLNFKSVVTLSASEVNAWIAGSFLTPPEGSLVRTPKNPTVYWVVNKTLHPINFGFYTQRGLNIFPVIYVSDEDMRGFSKGDAYIL